jgi:hypothetical protein
MKYSLKAEGQSIDELEEIKLNPGEYGQLVLYLSSVPSEYELSLLHNQLIDSGIVLTSPVKYVPETGTVIIEFQEPKSVGVAGIAATPALYTIGGVLGAITLIGGFIFVWQVSSRVNTGGFSDLWIIAGIVGLVVFLRSSMVKKAGAAAGKAAKEVGKTYLDRKLFIDKDIRSERSDDILARYRSSAREAQRAGYRPEYEELETQSSQYLGPAGSASGSEYPLAPSQNDEEKDDR